MTTVQQENVVKAAAIAGLPEAIAESMKTLAAHQLEFETALAEIRRHDEEISRFEKARDASKAAADEANAKIRSDYKAFGINAKEAIKLKVARNGHMEDAENFQALIDDIVTVRKSSELKAHKAAEAYKDARRMVRTAAAGFVESVLMQRLPAELFMFIELTAEIASLRESVLFNTDPTVHSPLDFALREVSALIHRGIKQRNPDAGTASILPAAPESIGGFGKSPLQMQALMNEVAAAEAVQC